MAEDDVALLRSTFQRFGHFAKGDRGWTTLVKNSAYVIGALELSHEHSRVGGVNAQFLTKHGAEVLGSFIMIHDVLDEADLRLLQYDKRDHVQWFGFLYISNS